MSIKQLLNQMKQLLSIIFLVTISINVLAKDLKKSSHAAQKGNHQKSSTPRVELAIKHKKGKGVKQNHKPAYQHVQTPAKLKDNELANDFEDGLNAAKKEDYKTAIPLLDNAAKQNNSMAQVMLGLMYKNGKGVKQNQKTAFKHFLTAAKLNDSDGQFNVAQMYDHGIGTKKDDTEALKWYQLSAEQGVTDAQIRLGLMYKFGQNGVPQDYKLAQKWFNLAAQQGDPDAQLLLGKTYSEGDTINKDIIRAYAWTLLALSNGSEDALKEREALDKILNNKQREEAQTLSVQCSTSGFKNC